MVEPSVATSVPELLAPAGGPESLAAALQAGADAVYLGVGTFNARRGAENFTLESLREAVRRAHLLGSRVYLTANVLVLPEEVAEALDLVDAAWAVGVDAVIVQDLGLLRLLRERLPHVRVHASTQLNAHDPVTVEELARLGASRVTLAREVSLAEIAAVAGQEAVEVETFVHGSLCFCYSGQCLMSSMIGGRSANRGVCAQPCRLPYRLLDERGSRVGTPGRFLLSPKDLAGIDLLPRLAEAGVAALKIEGRMKSPEYVALVTGVYRAALDRLAAEPEGFAVTEAEWSVLEEAFSRGFTHAYLEGERGSAMMSYSRPNNRGVPVARVASYADGVATLTLERALEADDQVEFWTGRGRFAQTVGRMRREGKQLNSAPSRSRVEVRVERPVGAGDRVFRVANAALLGAARRLLTPAGAKRRVPATFTARVRIGEPLRIEVEAAGERAAAEGPVVERARTKPITGEEIAEHIDRLGDTAYRAEGVGVQIDAEAGLSYSAVHQLRAQAVAALDEVRLAPWAGRCPHRPEAPSAPAPVAVPEGSVPELVVAVSDLDLAQACLREGADRALLAVSACDRAVELPPRVEPLLPRVAHASEHASLLRWVRSGERVTVGTLGLLRLAADAGAQVSADWPLNVANPWAAEELAGLGASAVWASPELTERQLAAVAAAPVPVGALAFGRLELMVAEHCVLQAAAECDERCAVCERRAKKHVIEDQKGYRFPVVTDATGRSHLYNSVTMDLSRALPDLTATGVSSIRMELHGERKGEALEFLRAFKRLLRDVAAGRPAAGEALVKPATSGHFRRGVV